MAFLSSLDIAGSGMTAQRRRLDVIAENMTNRDTLHTEDGGPYRRKLTVFREIEPQAGYPRSWRGAGASSLVSDNGFSRVYNSVTGRTRALTAQDGLTKGGVMVERIFEEDTPLVPVYDPNHPDANEEGYVMMPNVDTTVEMVDAMAATRSYSANVAAFEALKTIAKQALEIGK